MSEECRLSDSQWKKIYNFFRRISTIKEWEVGGPNLYTSDHRTVHYTYRQLFLCLCTEACIQRDGYVILAPIHILHHDERVSISNAAVMQFVNDAYRAYKPHLPKPDYYIDPATGNKILIHPAA